MRPKVEWNIRLGCKIFESNDRTRFMENTHKFIKENHIKIISARHNYQQQYPNDYRKWKIAAFLEINDNFQKDVRFFLKFSNILSILCVNNFELKSGDLFLKVVT